MAARWPEEPWKEPQLCSATTLDVLLHRPSSDNKLVYGQMYALQHRVAGKTGLTGSKQPTGVRLWGAAGYQSGLAVPQVRKSFSGKCL